MEGALRTSPGPPGRGAGSGELGESPRATQSPGLGRGGGGGEERPGGSGAAGGRGETWSPRPRSHHHTGPFPRGWHARWLGWGAGWGGVGSES